MLKMKKEVGIVVDVLQSRAKANLRSSAATANITSRMLSDKTNPG